MKFALTCIPMLEKLILCLWPISRIPDLNRHEYPSNGNGNTGEKVY